jgi:hypothetical protein
MNDQLRADPDCLLTEIRVSGRDAIKKEAEQP